MPPALHHLDRRRRRLRPQAGRRGADARHRVAFRWARLGRHELANVRNGLALQARLLKELLRGGSNQANIIELTIQALEGADRDLGELMGRVAGA